jgi:hypothetical protein
VTRPLTEEFICDELAMDDDKLEDESGSKDESVAELAEDDCGSLLIDSRLVELDIEDAGLLLANARLALLPLPPPQANNNIHQHTNSACTPLLADGRDFLILFFSPMWLTPS